MRLMEAAALCNDVCCWQRLFRKQDSQVPPPFTRLRRTQLLARRRILWEMQDENSALVALLREFGWKHEWGGFCLE